MKKDIWDLLLEAEIMAETPRSNEVFDSIKKQKGHPLSVAYDLLDYLQALQNRIKPSEILRDMGIDMESFISNVKKLFCVDIRDDMTVGEVIKLTQSAL